MQAINEKMDPARTSFHVKASIRQFTVHGQADISGFLPRNNELQHQGPCVIAVDQQKLLFFPSLSPHFKTNVFLLCEAEIGLSERLYIYKSAAVFETLKMFSHFKV